MFDNLSFYSLSGLFTLSSLLFIISFTSGAPNAMRTTEITTLYLTKPDASTFSFLCGMQFNDRKNLWKKEERRKEKRRSAWKRKEKYPQKACIFPAWAHCTFLIAQTHVSCIKTAARRINLPQRAARGRGGRVIRSRIIVGPLESSPNAAIFHIDLCELKGSLMLRWKGSGSSRWKRNQCRWRARRLILWYLEYSQYFEGVTVNLCDCFVCLSHKR